MIVIHKEITMTYGKLLELLKELPANELDKEIAFYSSHYETLQNFSVSEITEDDEEILDFYDEGKAPKLVFAG